MGKPGERGMSEDYETVDAAIASCVEDGLSYEVISLLGNL